MSQLFDLLTALSPLLLAVVLVYSGRFRYRSELADERKLMVERDSVIVDLHFCKEQVQKLQDENAGLRWLVSTYGVKTAPTRPLPAGDQVAGHILAALTQEKANLAFLKEQTARYGDADLARHNQIEGTEARIKELEGLLDAQGVGALA